MRITGGEFGGRNLLVPKSDAIRPTQDRVREALFNILMAEIPGATFLDLFAGCGAVGLEALSRGATTVTFVEMNRKHVEVLKKNVATFLKTDVARADVRVGDVYKWVQSYVGSGYTIGFADPPYQLGEEKGYADFLKILATRDVIRVGGIFIAEMTAHQKAEDVFGWELLRDRTYGKTRLCLWRRTSA